MPPMAIPLSHGYRGFVSIVVNAGYNQRVFLDVCDKDNSQITAATFEGTGGRVNALNKFDNRPSWSFGPFNYDAILYVKITHQPPGGKFSDSKMVGPLSITKDPEPDYPMRFLVSTVISEDGVNQSHDDCTATILQCK